ncbi:MAG: calcium/sodium antiporter [Myxococcota bacterium]
MALAIVGFIGGLVALYFGAEWLVSGASSCALRFGVAPLVVGLTVVAFGTSAPELLVSLLAIREGNDGISVGNIIGSNIANIALILGCAAMVRPIEVHEDAVKREYPIMFAASALLVLLCQDFVLQRYDGAIMLTGMAAFLGVSVWRGLKGDSEEIAEELEDIDPDTSSLPKDMGLIALGIVGLAIGAYFLVENAVFIAKQFHIPDLVIGITMVAIGTSLPELATSVVAAYRGASDISVGNVIGSNVFNVLLVLGLVSTIVPIEVSEVAVREDLWVMIAISIIIWPLMRTGFSINRTEGFVLVLWYLVYTVYLFVR